MRSFQRRVQQPLSVEEKTGTLRRLAAVKTEPTRRPDRMPTVKQQDRQRSMAVYMEVIAT